jgi:hypothetical protein
MNRDVRLCVAYIAGRLISGSESNNIYDSSLGRYVFLSGNVGSRRIRVHDSLRDCDVTGEGGQRTGYALYDHGASHHLSFRTSGERFEGYDFGSTCHFRGHVDGNSISLYDYGEDRNFTYRF